MENSDNITLIEKYLRDELGTVERENFQKKLATDKALADALEVEQSIFNAIQVAAETNFRSRLQQMEVKTPPTAIVRSINWKPWAIAASILFFIGLGWYNYPLNPTTSAAELYAANYIPPTFSTTRNNTNIAPSVASVVKAYQQKEFETTIQQLAPYLQNNYDAKLGLVLGASYLETEQWPAAIKAFETVRNQSELKDDATWYLGLAYLKSNQLHLAKTEFQRLLSNEFLVTDKRKAKVTDILKNME